MTDETRGEEDVRAERDELARHLFHVLYDLHPVYGSTSGPHGGIGGQAVTPWCHVNHPYSDDHQTALDDAEQALREQFRRAEREGYDLLGGSR